MVTPSGTGELPVRPTDADRGSDTSDLEAEDLASLRAALLGPEQRRLAALQRRLDDPDARAEDIAAVLPHVLLQHTQDPQFVRALTPPVEKALTASVRRDPTPLADALFPVMGPAIRRAVAAAITGMVESLNRTLEHSVSWKSIRWRLEARRTGRSFAEVVLLKTLVYRVEQVLLIDRRTGLLLQHVHHLAPAEDADMVSGMLTAIRDFVQDSFKARTGETESLEALRVGDLSVWIEAGPRALVAAVIRGTAPRELRRTLQDAIEEIHLRFAEPLETFSGDAGPFADARSVLEGCLATEFRQDERKPSSRGAWILLGAATAALLVWAAFAYRAHARWTSYVTALRAEPGVVVVGTSREGGRYVVSGLRDPLARDPRTLLAAAALSEDGVDGRWAPYYSLDPAIVRARAEATLRPPAGTTLTFADGVLGVSGSPSSGWIAEASRLAPFVPGVTRFDAAGALDGSMRGIARAIEARPVLFVKGASRPASDQRETIEALIASVRALADAASAAGARLDLDIVGHTDADGPPDSNVPLSRARADAVAALVRPAAGPAAAIRTRGVGSAEPAVAGGGETDNQRNRRVVIHATIPGQP